LERPVLDTYLPKLSVKVDRLVGFGDVPITTPGGSNALAVRGLESFLFAGGEQHVQYRSLDGHEQWR
jgi:hypothetical protein